MREWDVITTRYFTSRISWIPHDLFLHSNIPIKMVKFHTDLYSSKFKCQSTFYKKRVWGLLLGSNVCNSDQNHHHLVAFCPILFGYNVTHFPYQTSWRLNLFRSDFVVLPLSMQPQNDKKNIHLSEMSHLRSLEINLAGSEQGANVDV